jgi:hypothetical protein
MYIKYFDIDLDTFNSEILLTYRHVTFINETSYPYDVYQGTNKILTVPQNSQIDLRDVLDKPNVLTKMELLNENVYIKIVPYSAGQQISIINYGG